MLYFLKITDLFFINLRCKKQGFTHRTKKSKQKLLFITVETNLIYYFIASRGNVLHTVNKVILLLLLQISANYVRSIA
jgi:hypothetical protein